MRTSVFALLLSLLALSTGQSARAAVVELSADIRSVVRSFVNDADDSFDEATEAFVDDNLPLPIDARANLETLDNSNQPVAGGVALSDFRDPTEGGPQRNPGEIGIEADCYSNDAATRFELESSVIEKRIVSFTADDLGNPIGGTQSVRSALFASGAIFAWSREAGRDLTGLFGEVSFVVRSFDVDESTGEFTNETTLVNETVALRGGPDGVINFENTARLFVFNGDLSILPDVSEVPDSIGLDTLAVSRVAVILQQNIQYEYDATAEHEIKLEAEFTTRVANVPDGTGVVAVFGRPFDEVIPILEAGIPADSAKNIGPRLNKAIAEFKAPAARPIGGASPCGVLGFELLPMLGLSVALCFQRPSRRMKRAGR